MEGQSLADWIKAITFDDALSSSVRQVILMGWGGESIHRVKYLPTAKKAEQHGR